MNKPEEPKRAKSYHTVWTIYRTVPFTEEVMSSFNTEVAEFLDSGYTCLGAGMGQTRVFAVMAKRIVVAEQSLGGKP